MSGNKNLNSAAKAKKDEFYTRLTDIEHECKNYKHFFRDKIIFCNCDDPYESNFFKYFAMHFNDFGLKKLIATCYDGSPVAGTQISLFDTPVKSDKKPFKIEINEVDDYNLDGRIDLLDVEFLIKNKKNVLTLLEGNGDFRSPECVQLLQQSDIVVTNPPFSLFREYVAQLIKFDKKFLIIGNQNSITYKEIFLLIMQNKIWLGYGFQRDPAFKVPDNYEERTTRFWIDENGQKWRSFGNMHWFTNLDVQRRHENIILYKKYSPEKYPKYDNYDVIEVSKTAEIPQDFYGVMGVPITFLDKYNPEQFEILGIANSARWIGYECYTFINGKKIYNRILIRRR
ncbi:MAG: adenine-specific methyltransferase EcoRI family protein [Selenomonadaceae bacterium]|nr:adenine-specific methyltransferase EcoRI family protein [Selenomonadaceae bacterium]